MGLLGYRLYLSSALLETAQHSPNVAVPITYWHYWVPVASHTSNICSDFIISSNLLNVWLYFIMVLSIYLIPNKIEHMFIFLKQKVGFLLLWNHMLDSLLISLFVNDWLYVLCTLDTTYVLVISISSIFSTLWFAFLLCVVSVWKGTRSCSTNIIAHFCKEKNS